MSEDNNTLARPYAEAAFKRAVETNTLDQWPEMLAFLAAIATDRQMVGVFANPRVERGRMAELVLDIAGERLSEEGRNLVRLMAENRRLAVLPELAELFEQFRSEHQGTVEAEVVSAFPLDEAHEKALADALGKRLGKTVTLTSKQDQSLIGGMRIRAGDLVIDGSVQGQLKKLATELGA